MNSVISSRLILVRGFFRRSCKGCSLNDTFESLEGWVGGVVDCESIFSEVCADVVNVMCDERLEDSTDGDDGLYKSHVLEGDVRLKAVKLRLWDVSIRVFIGECWCSHE